MFQLQQKKPTMPKTMRNPFSDGSCRSFIEESAAKILNFPFLFFKIGITSTHFHFKLPKFVTKDIFTCILGIGGAKNLYLDVLSIDINILSGIRYLIWILGTNTLL